ncbi:U2 snRNP-associated SURP motif-containing protein [Diabrotica undecimpunctata]|uniref:U2 snRNP-associated SURP motif-containing protein n=1 Tax=Diabrotica undecimpunctata TaxID=50387 RepID=UPI003B637B3D
MSDTKSSIAEQKLKAFTIGTMGKRTLSKRELEEQRKREEEEAAAHVFQEFVETFQEAPINGSSKVWVKAGTYDAGARKEDTREKGKLYKPTSRLATAQDQLSSADRAQAYAKLLTSDRKPERLGKKKQTAKSNLESFMEELRQIQEEREERHKYKGAVKTPLENELDMLMRSGDIGSFDNGDPNTTNLYLGNLNPKITEQQLLELFGRFGPLASIKIMWPRSDEEKARGRNCGFVAYMSRKDGERALKSLSGKDVFGYEMKLGWGKAVIIPPYPIYVPPVLLDISQPPPPSGLPFNAQPAARDKDVLPKSQEELNEILSRAVVKVVIPNDRNLIMLIHRMVEFVVREGPMFEAMIMNKELQNPQFRFLFENQSPPHIYYRWKVYSILHGDSQKEWNTKEFRMFKNGSIWKPPLMNCYTLGMPEELIKEDDSKESSKGSLSNSQRDRLEDILRQLTHERNKIGEAMVFCIEHSEAAEEVAECIAESLSNKTTLLTKKIARLYLISDILHNCQVKVSKASFFRKAFELKLVEIFKCIKETYDNLEGRLQAEGFRVRVLRVLKAWDDTIYPKDFMTKLNNIFLGISEEEDKTSDKDLAEDIDGNPLDPQYSEDDNPVDGTLLKSAMMLYESDGEDFDIDGEEIQEETKPDAFSGFVTSKWETVDPEQVEAQAMTTSKWDMLDNSQDDSQESGINEVQEYTEYQDRDLSEEKRQKLREIEVKAVQYQDELESGQRQLKSGWTLPQQVEHYRRKLLRKSEKEKKEKTEKSSKGEKHKRDYEKSVRKLNSGDSSDDEHYYKELTSKKSKKLDRSSSSSSTSRRRSKSRSPSRKKRSLQTPSPPRIKKHSSPSRSSRKNRDSASPSSLDKYSPKRYRDTSKHRKSSSPSRSRHGSPGSSRSSRYHSPDVSTGRKHRHKHKH